MSLVSSRVLSEQAFGVRHANCAVRPTRGNEAVRQAVLLAMQDPLPEQCSLLQELSGRQWRQLSQWLHLSGLALYFFDRLCESGRQDILPADLSTSLQNNLKDNVARTRSMISESIAIQAEFQELRVEYAVLKGLSLWPSSFSKPELRSQFDLDFLVAEETAATARKLLERRGYRLYNISGRSWEFKRNERPGVAVNDMYKDFQSWAVELHIEQKTSISRSKLVRRQWRDFFGFTMPVLSPVDLFIGQGLHAYKHLCGEFMRASHLEEFRHHILCGQSETEFWNMVQQAAADDPAIAIKLGLVIQLITHVTGEFAPDALTSWTIPRLPAAANLWVHTYGSGAVLGSFPGSKRSLLLQKAIEQPVTNVRQRPRMALVPLQLPPPIMRAFPNEDLPTKIARNWMQLKFIAHRLRFHLTAGVDYVWQSRRWRRVTEKATP